MVFLKKCYERNLIGVVEEPAYAWVVKEGSFFEEGH